MRHNNWALLAIAIMTIGLLMTTNNIYAETTPESDPSEAIDSSTIDCAFFDGIGCFDDNEEAFTSDDTYATGFIELDQAYGAFGFDVSIPAGATINGITINLEGHQNDFFFGTIDCGDVIGDPSFRVQLSDPTLIGDPTVKTDFTGDVKTTSDFGTTDSIVSLGGATDTWGNTYPDLNNFWVLVTSECGVLVTSLALDHVTATVDYTLPSGGGHVGNFVNSQQPSIGIREDGKRVVDGGLTVNGQTVDADFYFTPFPLIQSGVGEPIDFIFKIWDDRVDNIETLQVQLGKGKVGESFSMDSTAQYKRDKMTNEVTITHDPMFTNVIMEQLEDQPCKVGGNDCTVIHVNLTPTEAIVGDVVFGVNIWDEARNANTSFFNEGLQVGTEADVIVEESFVTPTVIKKQLRTDDGYGNIDKRYSEAFAMKKAWHTDLVVQKAIELGYLS